MYTPRPEECIRWGKSDICTASASSCRIMLCQDYHELVGVTLLDHPMFAMILLGFPRLVLNFKIVFQVGRPDLADPHLLK